MVVIEAHSNYKHPWADAGLIDKGRHDCGTIHIKTITLNVTTPKLTIQSEKSRGRNQSYPLINY